MSFNIPLTDMVTSVQAIVRHSKRLDSVYKLAAPVSINTEKEGNIMKIAVFAKRKTKNDEKKTPFYIYLSSLTNKETGETMPVRVKFRDECGKPDPSKCPMFITFDKKNANLQLETYVTDDGEERTVRNLWIAKWTNAGEYVDTSLDEFE